MKNAPFSLRCLYKFILDNTEKPMTKIEASSYLFYLYLQYYKDNQVLLFPPYHFHYGRNIIVCPVVCDHHNESDKSLNYENLNIDRNYDFESHMALVLRGMELVGGNKIIKSIRRLPNIKMLDGPLYHPDRMNHVTECDIYKILDYVKNDLSIVRLTYR